MKYDEFEGKIYGQGESLWKRAKVIAPNGETKVDFIDTSNNTISVVRLENVGIIDQIKLASKSARIYINRHGEAWARNPDAATQKLTLFLREKHPALDGRDGNYIMSDSGFKDLINRALDGEKAGAANIYDKENERTAKVGSHNLTAETSKTYRKKSKPNSRQRKQTRPGRPRKNHT